MDIFKEDLNSRGDVSAGNLLLAEPMLFDPNFQRSVVLVCEHNETNGTFGLVLNKKADVVLDDESLPHFLRNNLFIGGLFSKIPCITSTKLKNSKEA